MPLPGASVSEPAGRPARRPWPTLANATTPGRTTGCIAPAAAGEGDFVAGTGRFRRAAIRLAPYSVVPRQRPSTRNHRPGA
ncbi:hypothetical protein GCM10018779_42980 [Streptomyces griseocarneus]|nr:hypothetical protein GCM10018779_42980 [Streptomyces griseocarneus]